MLARCENSLTELMNFLPASRPPLMPKPEDAAEALLEILRRELRGSGRSGSPG